MADKSKSKTDVAARAGAKYASKFCSLCGNQVEVVLSVSSTGRKNLRRICCER